MNKLHDLLRTLPAHDDTRVIVRTQQQVEIQNHFMQLPPAECADIVRAAKFVYRLTYIPIWLLALMLQDEELSIYVPLLAREIITTPKQFIVFVEYCLHEDKIYEDVLHGVARYAVAGIVDKFDLSDYLDEPVLNKYTLAQVLKESEISFRARQNDLG